MWQEITVITIVMVAVLYFIRRNWKRFRPGKGKKADCAGSCASCGQRSGCPLDQEDLIRPGQIERKKRDK